MYYIRHRATGTCWREVFQLWCVLPEHHHRKALERITESDFLSGTHKPELSNLHPFQTKTTLPEKCH